MQWSTVGVFWSTQSRGEWGIKWPMCSQFQKVHFNKACNGRVWSNSLWLSRAVQNGVLYISCGYLEKGSLSFHAQALLPLLLAAGIKMHEARGCVSAVHYTSSGAGATGKVQGGWEVRGVSIMYLLNQKNGIRKRGRGKKEKRIFQLV